MLVLEAWGFWQFHNEQTKALAKPPLIGPYQLCKKSGLSQDDRSQKMSLINEARAHIFFPEEKLPSEEIIVISDQAICA